VRGYLIRVFVLVFLIWATFLAKQASAQGSAVLMGRVLDEQNNPVEFVNIALMGFPGGAVSDGWGNFELTIPAGRQVTIAFSHVNYERYTRRFRLEEGQKEIVSITLVARVTTTDTITISATRGQSGSGLQRVDPKTARVNPGPGEGISSILKTQAGVMSNNELSSQYNVRGGNFDENLVYVNGVEIFRPLLVRSGQQEGLSFVNSDLVASIAFSSGGFDAKYGDKMSSVLDVTYRKPEQLAGGFEAGLLGASAHVEGQTFSRRMSYMIGVRQKSNAYLLGSLETKGSYKPSFTDVQSYLVFDAAPGWELSFLGNYSRNLYRFIPETRQTDYGTVNEALRLTVYFDGQEADRFESMTGALTATYRRSENLHMRFILSAYRSLESVSYDILGQYWLDQLETDPGKDDFGDIAFNLGVGAYLDHARNYLESNVISLQHKAWYSYGKGLLQWGINLQHEAISDRINEWQVIDSAGFSLPHPADIVGYSGAGTMNGIPLEFYYVLKGRNEIMSQRLSGFIQDGREFDSTGLKLNYGIRASYWSYNGELTISPRASLTWKPSQLQDWAFRIATGVYHQPPFYRELLTLEGDMLQDQKAQRSVHFVVGAEKDFKAWGRPFHLLTDMYYKLYDRLIPYEIDNVRIRYHAGEEARGYAVGADFKVNGEFVKGVDSWMSLSLLQTLEDIIGDYYWEYYNQAGEKIIPGYTWDQVAVDSLRFDPGYVRRPSDQRFTFSLFFQDYFPRNPSYKMHLNLVYGSRLPFGPPSSPRYMHVLKMPPYRRVDIGFSKQIKEPGQYLKPGNPFRNFQSAWISLEVFNLLAINNTISYIWVTDVRSRMYAVPNYLTPRRLNLRLVCEF
jgi:hypothetical protein